MWDDLTRKGGPLDDCGALSHLKLTSLGMLERSYGRWLGWLACRDPDALRHCPADRATMARIADWLNALDHTTATSQLMYARGMLRVLWTAAPDKDWRAQRQLKAHLTRLAGRGNPERKHGRVLSSAVLLSAGLKLAGPFADVATTELQAAKRRRNGTMIATLALLPMRRRAFASLRLGHSIFVSDSEILVALYEDMTKTESPWETPVPIAIAPLLRRYLNEVRPWLMARGGHVHDYVWVGDVGQPLSPNYTGDRIAAITKAVLGVRIPPHLFRDAAATTLARISPESARLIPPVLGHSSLRTAERHYIHAGSIEAGRDYAAVIRQIKGDRR